MESFFYYSYLTATRILPNPFLQVSPLRGIPFTNYFKLITYIDWRQQLIHFFRCFILHNRQNMRVGIQGHGSICMTESLLNDLRMRVEHSVVAEVWTRG